MLKKSKSLFAAFSLSLLSLGNSALAQMPAPVVELAEVSESAINGISRLPGSVISKRDASIAAEISGRLSWIADVGQQLSKGQTLAIIDDHLLKLQLRNNRASIDRIKADIDYQHRQQKRLLRLIEKNNIAQSELDQVESRLAILKQDLRIAEIDRDRTLYDLQRSKVTAPFTGVIAKRSMSEGEFTQAGKVLLRLVDTENLEISVNAPLRIARFNQVGSQVVFESEGKLIQTQIRGAVPVGDQRSRMMELRLTAPQQKLFIGEAVTVELANSESHNALLVPRDALILRENQVYVYTLSQDNKAKRISVTPGTGSGEQIAVRGALKQGDRVIIRGAESLRDGQEVKIVERIAKG